MSTPDTEQPPQSAAAIFAALGDPTRLWLVSRLSRSPPRSIAQLSVEVDITRQAVTKHLDVLENAGVIRSQRLGREKRFEFVPETLENACDYLDSVSAQWDEALRRLSKFVES